MNPLHPDMMSAEERLAELGEILARGVVRLKARKSSQLSGELGDSSLDLTPDQRGHANETVERRAK